LLQNRPQISEANVPGVGHIKLHKFLSKVNQLVWKQCVSNHVHADLHKVAPLDALIQSLDDIEGGMRVQMVIVQQHVEPLVFYQLLGRRSLTDLSREALLDEVRGFIAHHREVLGIEGPLATANRLESFGIIATGEGWCT